jgi:hypothetical protein
LIFYLGVGNLSVEGQIFQAVQDRGLYCTYAALGLQGKSRHRENLKSENGFVFTKTDRRSDLAL